MGAVLDKKSIEAAVAARVGNLFAPSQRVSQQPMATGIPTVDLLTGGLPRGCITEISGEVSSGRTSFVAAVLAEASHSQECIAYIDVTDSLDPATMHQAGVDLDRLLWVRCGGKLDQAVRVADLVLQGGGFGITVLDLAGVTPQWVRRIPMAYWFRFRRAVENKPCCCILVDQTPCAGTCAALLLEMRRDETVWSGPPEFRLLTSVRFNVRKKKPMGLQECAFESRAETGICNVSVTRGPRRVAPASRRH